MDAHPHRPRLDGAVPADRRCRRTLAGPACHSRWRDRRAAASGVPSFALLQETLKAADRPLVYVFDLLFLEGRDLRGAGLQQRKSLLEALVGAEADPLFRPPDRQRPPFFENACRMALEGVSKRMSAPYRSGRTREWLKSKCVERQEFVIGGFTKPTTKVRGIGALLLGYYDDEAHLRRPRRHRLQRATSRALREQLEGILADKPPFAAFRPRRSATRSGSSHASSARSSTGRGRTTAGSATPPSRACARTDPRSR